jgi:hypothetical protein
MESMNKIEKIANGLAVAFVKDYKCPLPEAVGFFYDKLSKNDEVLKVIESAASDKQLSKNATFKEFVKKNKKELYYKLRRYKAVSDLEMSGSREELLEKLSQVHVSSQERFAQNDVFYTELAKFISNASIIADVGCGVQPLYFPKDKFPAVTQYIALDKDRESINILHRFKDTFPGEYCWLHPKVWNISDGWDEPFDVALILKVVPVVKRIDPSLLDELAKVPANTIIVSGVKESMVKKHDIEHKERRAIANFIKACGRAVTAEFELDNEFFLILS